MEMNKELDQAIEMLIAAQEDAFNTKLNSEGKKFKEVTIIQLSYDFLTRVLDWYYDYDDGEITLEKFLDKTYRLYRLYNLPVINIRNTNFKYSAEFVENVLRAGGKLQ